MSEEKNKGGRPSSYNPIYCEQLKELMSKGYSYEAFAGSIGVCKQTLYNWEENHQEFLDAKKEAFAACQFYWETLGMKGVEGTVGVSASIWIFNMKNRFGWKDRKEIDNKSSDGSMTPTINFVEK